MQEKSAQKGIGRRIIWMDALNVFACFGVVALHCNGLVHSYGLSPERWPQALFVEVIFYWAVNVFFMLTGANNMSYRDKYSTKEFLVRRIKKLVIPWVLWSVFAYVLRGLVNQSDISVAGFLWQFICGGGVVGIYWFFPVIISLTLAMPVLSRLKEHRSTLWYYVAVSFAFISVIGPIEMMSGLKLTAGITFPIATYPLMLAVLGYLLSTTSVAPKHRILIYCLAVAALVFRFASTYLLSVEAGETVKITWGYGSFVGVIPAVAVFLLFQYHDWESGLLRNHLPLISKVASASFGVYLIHIFLLQDVVMGVFGIGYPSLALRVLGPFVLYGVSLVIVLVLKKIPILKNLTP